ncbi:MAG: DNA topoisomerase IV subunit A [Clostridium argentinense]|uniref:DNA topoisomerase (ATP-hydrolyzing) n=1 Tax=Clostridium faecium TaxID=2762223 RepID=A0ABR8YP12_9CLOT|nr:DNA topoisomerase IV subunit A [Clostridium faecium]MBD8045990.1 DNA topoisomerase IV subunit A [Clostridium faecium]MBS5824481.1 DNA topoisomerase IV subunit A [Clostridium argentinense]MDU1349540.1 DNA topoisomerase IV subunit A [Clostridium argentinense]
MAKKNTQIPTDNNIINTPLHEAMPDNYLPYAVEVSKDRALPDVRDGLKPVHRRILYGAYMLKAFPDKPYYKSARIVGDILGKYHPHGDTSVYDAMVILAQDFSTRMPLIDGHGNWGSIDGDSAAAMRYTEARLSNISIELLKDIDKNVVDMVDNYSDTEKEPAVLPARYPNLLVNGAFGIAVGLATNIPPHNLGEVIDGALAYADNSEITTKELMSYIQGPDLPTGGILIGKNALLAAYETGEGKVTLRAKTHIETLENGRLGIVITEFPYRKNKAKLLQSISDMTGDKKHSKALEGISDIRDESDREGIRAVIEFKKSATKESVNKVLKYLFKKTELQSNLSFNMVALANGKPETLGLKALIHHYVEHQKDVVTRRTKRELEIAEKRFHIVEGFIKAIDIMDEIIKTIRTSKSKKDAAINLIANFGFTELQAEAILEMMLYRLTGLEIKTFQKEYKELEILMRKLRRILDSEKELIKVIKKELIEIKEKYQDKRRTEIVENDDEAKIELEELIIEEEIVITISNEGFIKRTPLKSFNRTSQDVEDIDHREGDYNKFLLQSNTKDSLIFFTSEGNMYQLKGISIPEFKWKERGEKIESLIKSLDLSKEYIVAAFSIDNFGASRDVLLFTSSGMLKKTELSKFNTAYTKLSALKLRSKEKLVDVQLVSKDREQRFIKINTKNNLCFNVEEPNIEENDRNLLGKQIFNLPNNDEVVSIEYTDEYEFKEFFLSINSKGFIRTSNRKSNDKLITLTNSNEEILFFTERGKTYKLKGYILQNIDKKGINLVELLQDYNKDDKIISMISLNKYEDKKSFYFITKKGLIKRTLCSEFEGDYIVTIGYKLKTEDDRVISVSLEENDNLALIVTEKAMCIKFNISAINTMGKNASGVTAISLKDDDNVIFGDIIYEDAGRELDEKEKYLCVDKLKTNLILNSLNGETKIIPISDISTQNRAGRGKNIMLFLNDDKIKSVERE